MLMLTVLGSYSRLVSLVQGLSIRLTQFHSNRYGKYNTDAVSAWQLLKVSIFGLAGKETLLLLYFFLLHYLYFC